MSPNGKVDRFGNHGLGIVRLEDGATEDGGAEFEGGFLDGPYTYVWADSQVVVFLGSAGFDAELTWAAGEPASVIVETARRVRAHVIVLGEHHHGALGRFFGADVDAEVQRQAGCDVILA